MSTLQQNRPIKPIEYPDSDGQAIAENTLQFQWIVTIQGGLDSAFCDRPDVFVAGDLLWYPVEGDNKTRSAPDAMVAIGRPKGYRGSYRQWEEGGIAPQVVFEVLSPGNRIPEMTRKLLFYQKYGVEEYYIYDPDDPQLEIYIRQGEVLESVPATNDWISPRLGIRLDMTGAELVIVGPDGKRFKTYLELAAESDDYVKRVEEMERRAEEDRLALKQAQQRADQAQQRAEQARQRAERLAAKLKRLGVDPDAANGDG